MRAIAFSWEYPPRVVGALSGYVKSLTTELAANKVNVSVVTFDDKITGETVEPSGVKTIRVNNPVTTHIGVLTWVLTLNQEVERAAANIYYDANKKIDLIDVFDWHFIPAAVTLKNGLGIPFIFSVESLEDHRSPTANSYYNMAIKSVEWLGFNEAAMVNVKSQWMKEEVTRIYQTSPDKITVIPIGTEAQVVEVLKTYSKVVEAKRNAT
jgi:glycosyltransferase involved in cell wall biosynthesis